MMAEKWRKCLDKGSISGAILTDLSKAFDCILHDPLIATLAVNDFDSSLSESWRVFFPIDRKEQKINNAFNCYSEIIYGVSQGSVLGHLLFNIFNCDIFFDIIECDIAIYADDNTPYNFGFNIDNVIRNLEKSTNSLLNWFRENHMKANADKCHLLVSSDKVCTAKIEDFSIKKSTEERLLGVNMILTFHVMSLLFVKRQARNYITLHGLK